VRRVVWVGRAMSMHSNHTERLACMQRGDHITRGGGCRSRREMMVPSNGLVGKLLNLASEQLILQLVRTKCTPILLYGFECFQLGKADRHHLDFTFNRLCMKPFTRSPAIAEGPRDASCQLKSCQLPRNSAETTYTTSPGKSVV